MKATNYQPKAKSYNRLSNIYQLLETIVFGPWLQKARLAQIDALQDAQKVLILGEGDGRFLKELLKFKPHCQVDCIDSSEGMLERSKQRLKVAGLSIETVNFIHADALSYCYKSNHYDAIVSLFFLDNFTQHQLELLVPKLAKTLQQNGKWVVADFQKPQHGVMKYIGQSLIWIMYRFFRWQTDISTGYLANPKCLLEKELQLSESKTFLAGLLYSEVWAQKYR